MSQLCLELILFTIAVSSFCLFYLIYAKTMSLNRMIHVSQLLIVNACTNNEDNKKSIISNSLLTVVSKLYKIHLYGNYPRILTRKYLMFKFVIVSCSHKCLHKKTIFLNTVY